MKQVFIKIAILKLITNETEKQDYVCTIFYDLLAAILSQSDLYSVPYSS